MKEKFPYFKTLLFFLFVLQLFASAAFSFDIPERLQYDLTWTGIKAGQASLEARDYGNYIQLISQAESAKWVSIFYTVDDTVVATLKKDENRGHYADFAGVPYMCRMSLREGKFRRDKDIFFNHAARKVTYINHSKKEAHEFNIKEKVFDPLSCFYYMRTLPLVVGKSVYVELFDNMKSYQLEIQVLRRETLTTPLGSFNTLLVKPLMKSEGTFNRKGDILIWLTDDEKKIPVQMKTKVTVGSVKAVLVGGHY